MQSPQNNTIMETQEPPPHFDDDAHENTIVTNNILSSIDTSRPFRSVKEAIAIFDERLLAGVFFSPKPFITTISNNQDIIAPKPPLPPLLSPSSHSTNKQLVPREDGTLTMKNSLKKLEVELEETKRELSLLKERESETEIALASLNAQLHKSMSKMAEAEAADAGAKAVAAKRSGQVIGGNYKYGDGDGVCEEIMKMENYSSSLAEVLSLGEKEGYFEAKKKDEKRMVKKKKPIIPLLGELFSRKKSSSKSLYNPLYTSTFAHSYFN